MCACILIPLADDGEDFVETVTEAIAEGFGAGLLDVAAGEADDGEPGEADGADAGTAVLDADDMTAVGFRHA